MDYLKMFMYTVSPAISPMYTFKQHIGIQVHTSQFHKKSQVLHGTGTICEKENQNLLKTSMQNISRDIWLLLASVEQI